MASNPSQNLALELMTTGEKSGQWGSITNINMQIVDRATKGVGTITLTTTSYSLDTIDYDFDNSEGHYAVLVFAGTPGGTCTVTINPNDQQKVFIVRNTTPSSVVLTQGSGGNVTVPAGKATIVYATGAGSGAAVVDITPLLSVLQSANNLSDVASAAAARTNLGLTIGTDVQAWDANLDQIASLAVTDSNFIVGNGSAWVVESGATARTSLGLGSIATQDANSVTVTGGSISGITDIAVADGGTGASSADAARTNLGLVIGADVQAYDAALQSIAGLTTSANQLIYTTGSDTYATSALSAFGRTLIDDADAAAARTTLGLVIGTNVLAYDSNLQSFVTTFTLPTTDGAANQLMQTNGSATISFVTPSIDFLSDARTTLNGDLFLGGNAGSGVSGGVSANNVAVGVNAMQNGSSSSSGGIAIGTDAGQSFKGIDSVFIGRQAGQYVDDATTSYNTFIGRDAGRSVSGTTTSGGDNVGVGFRALMDFTSASHNVAIGTDAGTNITTGNQNVVIGGSAGAAVTTASNNTMLGYNAGINVTGIENIAVGSSAGNKITTGARNTAIGSFGPTGASLETVAIGHFSCEGSGNRNVAVGVGALRGPTSGPVATGATNVSVGYNSLNAITSGSNNVALGASAGASVTNGSNNIVVGQGAEPSSGSVSNEITIGNSSHKVLRLPWTSTVAGLPSASTVGAGARSFVTDATATTFASIVAGGGANGVPVYSDGTNWRIG